MRSAIPTVCLPRIEGGQVTMGSVDKVITVVRNGILAGTWKPGAPLPSARQLGEDLQVNKNTVSKAYGLLTREGLLDVSRGRRARAAPSARRSSPAQDVFRGELRACWACAPSRWSRPSTKS